jgi:hypothetical protein
MPRLRWWQLLTRSVRTTALAGPDGSVSTYTVDVRRGGDLRDGEVRARLYVDGGLHAVSKMPARFPVPGGHVVVAVRATGLRRCHYQRADGTAVPLTPHPASAEGRRARLARSHPRLSRLVGTASTVVVLVGVAVVLPQALAALSVLPPVADVLGTFESPLRLPLAVDVGIGVAVVLASTERALRLKATWLDDLART